MNRKINYVLFNFIMILAFAFMSSSVLAYDFDRIDRDANNGITASWFTDEAAVQPFSTFSAASTSALDPNDDITSDFIDLEFRNLIRRLARLGPNDPILRRTVSNVSAFEFYEHYNIKNLAGIEHFASLMYLICDSNGITDIDVSSNSRLIYLDCNYNNIKNIDVSGALALRWLDCSGNYISELDLSNNAQLNYIDTRQNLLTYIATDDPIAVNINTLQFNENIDVNSDKVFFDKVRFELDEPTKSGSTTYTVSGVGMVKGEANLLIKDIVFYKAPAGADVVNRLGGEGDTGDPEMIVGHSSIVHPEVTKFNSELTVNGFSFSVDLEVVEECDIWVELPLEEAFAQNLSLYRSVRITPENKPYLTSLTASNRYNSPYSTPGVTYFMAPNPFLKLYQMEEDFVFKGEIGDSNGVGAIRITIDIDSSTYDTQIITIDNIQNGEFEHTATLSRRAGYLETVGKAIVEYAMANDPTNWVELFYTSNLTVILDPSGFIYEAVPSNKLEGVNVTLYEKSKQTGQPVFWNAGAFGQHNPLTSDPNGYYEWMVPGGYWQVEATLSGYETYRTNWLRVPPPQFNVNFSMRNLNPPEVKNVKASAGEIEIEFCKYMIVDDILNPNNITVTVNNTPVSGQIVMLNNEVDYWHFEETEDIPEASGGSGEEFVSLVKFEPDMPFTDSSVVQLNISSNVRSYAGIAMGHGYTNNLTIDDPSVDLPLAEEWVSNKVYNGGDRVVHNGLLYEARWWSHNNTPDGHNADNPWLYVGQQVLAWRDDINYNAGTIVSYNGNNYISTFWITMGHRPGINQWDPWVLITD